MVFKHAKYGQVDMPTWIEILSRWIVLKLCRFSDWANIHCVEDGGLIDSYHWKAVYYKNFSVGKMELFCRKLVGPFWKDTPYYLKWKVGDEDGYSWRWRD